MNITYSVVDLGDDGCRVKAAIRRPFGYTMRGTAMEIEPIEMETLVPAWIEGTADYDRVVSNLEREMIFQYRYNCTELSLLTQERYNERLVKVMQGGGNG